MTVRCSICLAIAALFAISPGAVWSEDRASIERREREELEEHRRLGRIMAEALKDPPEVQARRRAESKRLLESLSSSHGYRLEAGEQLRYIRQSHTVRDEYLNAVNGVPRDAAGRFQYVPRAQTFLIHEDRLINYGGGHDGWKVSDLIRQFVQIRPFNIELPESLRDQKFAGDWIIRWHTTRNTDQAVKQFEQILNRDLGLAVRVRFEEVPREVYVVSGDYTYTPANPGMPPRGVTMNRQKFWVDHLLMYDKRADGDEEADPSVQPFELHQFLEYLEDTVHAPMIDEIDTPPTNLITIQTSKTSIPQMHLDLAVRREMILKNLCRQTGLQFRKEVRPVKRFLIDREPAPNASVGGPKS